MSDLTGRPAPLGIAADLWDLLACPCPAHAPLEVDASEDRLVCTTCRASFEVRDGIPVLLLDQARPGPTGVEGAAEG